MGALSAVDGGVMWATFVCVFCLRGCVRVLGLFLVNVFSCLCSGGTVTRLGTVAPVGKERTGRMCSYFVFG